MDSYTLVREIGKGAYGTAYIVQHRATGERFVLKKVRLAKQSLKERQGSLRELRLLSSLSHRNVLGCKDAWVEAGCNVCLLLELCESGDLATQLKIRQPSNYFPEMHLHEMLVQLASGLAYIHRNRVAHRDIKSSNILITAEGRLLLADFGLATTLDSEAPMSRTVVGTPGYMAPQLLGSNVVYDGYKNDIWGLGCVLYEASALKAAFSAFNMAGLVKKVVAGAPQPLPTHYSEEWRSVVKSMLVKEESKRPTAEDILSLPWLQEAKRRVTERFGPELGAGATDFVQLKPLPEAVQQLAEQFRQQQEEADQRQRAHLERKKVLQAKYAPQGLLRQQAQEELAALGPTDGVGKPRAPEPAGKPGRAGSQKTPDRRQGAVQTRPTLGSHRKTDTRSLTITPQCDQPCGQQCDQQYDPQRSHPSLCHSPQRPGSAPPSPSRTRAWDDEQDSCLCSHPSDRPTTSTSLTPASTDTTHAGATAAASIADITTTPAATVTTTAPAATTTPTTSTAAVATSGSMYTTLRGVKPAATTPSVTDPAILSPRANAPYVGIRKSISTAPARPVQAPGDTTTQAAARPLVAAPTAVGTPRGQSGMTGARGSANTASYAGSGRPTAAVVTGARAQAGRAASPGLGKATAVAAAVARKGGGLPKQVPGPSPVAAVRQASPAGQKATNQR